MYDYLHNIYYSQEWFSHEYRVALAEDFLDHYREIMPQDIYRWLWEGEFGPGLQAPTNSLDQLTYDLRLARMMEGAREQRLWESMGLGMHILKINLVPYVDHGCPLMRLLELSRKTLEMKANTLRFKKDWHFMKTQIVPGMEITVDQMNGFENTIAFHMTPEVSWSDHYMKKYGVGYRLVPRNQFFQFFPEFEPLENEYVSELGSMTLD